MREFEESRSNEDWNGKIMPNAYRIRKKQSVFGAVESESNSSRGARVRVDLPKRDILR